MKIAIIGADGMLGSEFVLLCKERVIDFSSYTINEIDITKSDSLVVIEKNVPNVIINCAAYTAVDNAEDDSTVAFAVNADGVKNIAELALSLGAKLVHFSTDYVFSGDAQNPYLEDAAAAPVSVYGKSKLRGEEYLQEVLGNGNFLLLRTAWLYGSNGKNFVSTMLRLAKERGEVRVVNDQVGCPTFAKDLALWTLDLLENDAKGIFHAVNNGHCSWYEFAKKIFELSSIKVDCFPVSSEEFISKAKRPRYSIFSNQKLQDTLGYNVREWSEALSEYLFLTKL